MSTPLAPSTTGYAAGLREDDSAMGNPLEEVCRRAQAFAPGRGGPAGGVQSIAEFGSPATGGCVDVLGRGTSQV